MRTTINLSSLLVAIILAAASTTMLQDILIVSAEGTDTTSTSTSSTTATCDETLTAPVVLPCPYPVPLKVSYVSRGSVDCGGALSLEQAEMAPQIKADPSFIDPDELYSLVLVDTTSSEGSFVHPVLHYGAVNIEGSSLISGLSLDRSDNLDVFSMYRGPSPPKPTDLWATPGIENTLFVYEYMLGSQYGDQIDVPKLINDSVLQFDYESFFDETVGGPGFENITSTYFVSGWCVEEPITTRVRHTDAPTSSSSVANTTASPAPIATVTERYSNDATNNVDDDDDDDDDDEMGDNDNSETATLVPPSATSGAEIVMPWTTATTMTILTVIGAVGHNIMLLH